MKKEDIMNWLMDWFKTNSINGDAEIENLISTSYFDAGLIDSFIFIQLIADIEEKYHIEFGNEQFEDRNFSTIEGLAEIIERTYKNV